jgi:hypothetical protein
MVFDMSRHDKRLDWFAFVHLLLALSADCRWCDDTWDQRILAMKSMRSSTAADSTMMACNEFDFGRDANGKVFGARQSGNAATRCCWSWSRYFEIT